MKKLFQNKSLSKSIQIFLVCLVVLGGMGNVKNVEAADNDILVYYTYKPNSTPKSFSLTGFTVQTVGRENSGELTDGTINLSNYGQLWIIDSGLGLIANGPPFTPGEISAIKSFRNNDCGGLLLSADDPGTQEVVNLVAKEFNSNANMFSDNRKTGGMCVDVTSTHLLYSGVNKLSSTNSDACLNIVNGNIEPAVENFYRDGSGCNGCNCDPSENTYGAVLDENEKGRIIFDSSSARFVATPNTCEDSQPDQEAKYHQNIAEWLNVCPAAPTCSITGSYPLSTWIPYSNTYSYSRTNENVSIEYVGGESYNITDGDVTILYREPDESSVDCNTNACGFLTLVKENNAPGDYYFLIGEDDFMPGGSTVCSDCSNEVCQAFKNNFISIISANLIGGTINYSAISRFGGLLGYSVITADNGVDKIHFIFADFMRTGFLATKGWNSVDIAGGLLSGSFTESVDMCSIFPSVPICTLTTNPTLIDSGGSSVLKWTTENTDSARIDNNIGDPAITSVSLPDSNINVTPASTVTYTMTVANTAGDTGTCSATVSIFSPPPGIPDVGHSTGHGNYFKYDKDIKLVFAEGAKFLLKIAGGLALFILILGGVYYITSGANPDGQTKAKKTITYAVIGLAIVLVSYIIIMAVESIGV